MTPPDPSAPLSRSIQMLLLFAMRVSRCYTRIILNMRRKTVYISIVTATILAFSILMGILDYYGSFGSDRENPLLVYTTLPLRVLGFACKQSPHIPLPPGSHLSWSKLQCPAWCNRRDTCRPHTYTLASLLNLLKPRPKDPRVVACGGGGGSWQVLSSGCVDACGTANALCTDSLEYGCDCGPGTCWDGSNCVSGSSATD